MRTCILHPAPQGCDLASYIPLLSCRAVMLSGYVTCRVPSRCSHCVACNYFVPFVVFAEVDSRQDFLLYFALRCNAAEMRRNSSLQDIAIAPQLSCRAGACGHQHPLSLHQLIRVCLAPSARSYNIGVLLLLIVVIDEIPFLEVSCCLLSVVS